MVIKFEKQHLQQLLITKSLKEIASDFNCSEGFVYRSVKKLGVKNPRGKSKKDYTNLVFGSWTVKSKCPDLNATWVCRCDCGTEKNVKSCSFLNGKSTKCMGCKRKDFGRITGAIWSNIRNGAFQRKLEFLITVQEAWCLYEKQNGKCALSGIDIDFKPRKKSTSLSRTQTTASLDRIDSSKGYTKENIQWVYKPLNMMKQKRSNEEFIKLCKMVAEHNE